MLEVNYTSVKCIYTWYYQFKNYSLSSFDYVQDVVHAVAASLTASQKINCYLKKVLESQVHYY